MKTITCMVLAIALLAPALGSAREKPNYPLKAHFNTRLPRVHGDPNAVISSSDGRQLKVFNHTGQRGDKTIITGAGVHLVGQAVKPGNHRDGVFVGTVDGKRVRVSTAINNRGITIFWGNNSKNGEFFSLKSRETQHQDESVATGLGGLRFKKRGL